MFATVYRDLDKKLDMSMGISVSFSHPILPLVEKEIDTIPAGIKNSKDSYYLDLYLHSSDVSRLSGIIASFDYIRKGDWLIVRLPGNELAEIAMLEKEMLSLPTSLLAASYVRGGRMFIHVRFHHSDLDKASVIVGRAATSDGTAYIEDFGPSRGTIWFLDETNSRIGLEMVSFEYLRPTGRADDSFPTHYAETNAEDVGDGMYRVIAYSESNMPVGEDTERIPGPDGLYSYLVFSPFMVELFAALGKLRIPVAAGVVKVNAHRIQAYQFIPKTLLQEFLELLFDLGHKHPEAELLVTGVQEYGKEVWDSI